MQVYPQDSLQTDFCTQANGVQYASQSLPDYQLLNLPSSKYPMQVQYCSALSQIKRGVKHHICAQCARSATYYIYIYVYIYKLV